MRRLIDNQGLAAVVRRFSERPRVAVIGDVVVDEYIYGQTDRISREAPVLIVRQEETERKLGGAANAAANLAALGARVTLIGAVGDDETGTALAGLCTEAGIEPRLSRVKGQPTESKIRILAGGINTTRQQMLRLDRGRNGPLPAAAAAALVEEIRRAAREAETIVVSDYGSGALCPEAIAAVLEVSREGARVCVDSRYNLGAFRGVLLAKPNEPELAAATGLPVGSAEDTVNAGLALQRALECEAVLVTRGRSGMALLEKGRSPDPIPAHGAAEAVDVTGAGDTVIATLALALASGASLGEAARVANIAGGLVVQKSGTATVSPEEILGELER